MWPLKWLYLKQKFSMLILIGVGLLLSFFVMTDFYTRPKPVVFFDVKQTTHLFLQQAAKQPLSQKTRHQLTGNFTQILEETIQHYAKQHRVIVLVKSSMIDGGRDVTAEIQAEIAKTMQDVKAGKRNVAQSE